MDQKEAEEIAWELYKVQDCLETVSGKDGMSEVGNIALDSMYNIIEKHPKIKIEFNKWRATGKIQQPDIVSIKIYIEQQIFSKFNVKENLL